MLKGRAPGYMNTVTHFRVRESERVENHCLVDGRHCGADTRRIASEEGTKDES